VIPDGLEASVPLPSPVRLVLRVNRCRLNVAITDRAVLIATVHDVPATASHPLQPAKTERDAGVAMSVTVVSTVYSAEQVDPQSIPDGLETTVPLPFPALLRVSVERRRLNVAVTDRDASIVTVHVAAETASHPLQPAKTERDVALAVSVTVVPLSKPAEHVFPQSIPAGLDVTVPLPSPVLLAASV